MESRSDSRNLWQQAWLAAVAALVFYIFFQSAKNGPFRAVNPFLDDPVDAIGSIAVQLGLVTGLLSLARGVRLRTDADHLLPRGRWIVNSGFLTWLAIVVTLIADGVMEFLHPSWDAGSWGRVLVLGLAFVADVDLLLGLAMIRARRILIAVPSGQVREAPGSLAGAIEDLWFLAKIVLDWLMRSLRFTQRPLAWVERTGDRLLAWLGTTPLDPERHPWRFVLAAGILVGILLVLAGFQEGPPPNFRIFLLLVAIFVGVETSAALLGFLIIGGILGIRPPIEPADDSGA